MVHASGNVSRKEIYTMGILRQGPANHIIGDMSIDESCNFKPSNSQRFSPGPSPWWRLDAGSDMFWGPMLPVFANVSSTYGFNSRLPSKVAISGGQPILRHPSIYVFCWHLYSICYYCPSHTCV